MRITISGEVGSGKSSVAKMLAEKLGYKYHSIGELMRQMAHEKNMHLSEISKIAEKDKKIDAELDEKQKELGKEDNFVMDSRLGFHWIKNSYKIFLKVNVKEAAKRIFNEKRKTENYGSLEEAEQHLKRRMSSEKIRYKAHYNIDFPPKEETFDLIIDTTNKSIKEVVEEIVKKIKGRDKK